MHTTSGTIRKAIYNRCPFFVAYGLKGTGDQACIVCEGEIPDTQTKVMFKDREQMEMHCKIYCEQNCSRCEHYISVMHHRWQDDEE